MSTPELKAFAVVVATVLSVVLGVLGYFAGYSAVKYKHKWQRGRGVGINLQGGLIGWFLIVIPLHGVILPRWFASYNANSDGQFAWWFGMACPMLIMVALLEASVKFVDARLRRYMHLLHLSTALAGLAMLAPSLGWLINLPVPEWVQQALIAAAYLTAFATEWLFLSTNKWKFVPKEPK